jgi:hypothetical protein
MIMKRAILSLMIAGIALGMGTVPVTGADKPKQSLDDRMHSLNELVKKKGLMQEALKGVSVETGVPLGELESMHQHHKETGPAGLLVACVMADETKKAPEYFVKKHTEGGKTWADLARENKVPIEKLEKKLESLERHVAAGPPVEKRK